MDLNRATIYFYVMFLCYIFHVCFLFPKGTVVLWVYWPSFNSAGDEGDSQHRNVINTFLGLVGSAITCFAMSALLNKESKFTMVRTIFT